MANPPASGSKDCRVQLLPVSWRECNVRPSGLKGEPDHLFHNNGDGTFTDVSEKAGVADNNAYYGMSSVFVDVNNDGKADLLVSDDSTPNYLYINKGMGPLKTTAMPQDMRSTRTDAKRRPWESPQATTRTMG